MLVSQTNPVGVEPSFMQNFLLFNEFLKLLAVITQRTTRSSGYWTEILISIKCPEGTNATEYMMSQAARANEIQHRAWKLQYYNTGHVISQVSENALY